MMVVIRINACLIILNGKKKALYSIYTYQFWVMQNFYNKFTIVGIYVHQYIMLMLKCSGNNFWKAGDIFLTAWWPSASPQVHRVGGLNPQKHKVGVPVCCICNMPT